MVSNSNYRGVSLKTELVDQIEELMEKLGRYRSVADFVSEACRLRLEELTNKTEVLVKAKGA